ncbi:hypothetical protein [Microbispora sp. H13382]|uniref:hypothetical protein n=1 Tax=Microbispora sp. H13382 TaxID=2729112 RepID=UPI00160218FD|nr:hypothetical protein [Microbispora sp. H13382]
MLTIELDPTIEQILARLPADGRSATDVVREAIRLADRLHWLEQARTDAERLGRDPDDLAEVRAIRRELGDPDAHLGIESSLGTWALHQRIVPATAFPA